MNKLKNNEIWIIHFEGPRKYNERLSKLFEKAKAKILNAKSDHEKYQDKHVRQWQTISNDIDTLKYSYRVNPCYKKITSITFSDTHTDTHMKKN